MNLVKSSMGWPCWSISWASTAEWAGIWKRLHETKMRIYNIEHIQHSIQHFYFQHALIHGCIIFIQAKLRLYWERTWQIILRDSGFTRLMISIDNREILKFSTFNVLIHGCIWFNSGKVTSLLGEDLTDYSCDSGFTRLTMSIDNKERLKFSTFISNMRSLMVAYDLIQAKLRLYWERVTDYLTWLHEFVSIS